MYRIAATPEPPSFAASVTLTGWLVCQPLPLAAGAADGVVTGASVSATTVKPVPAAVSPAPFVAVTV